MHETDVLSTIEQTYAAALDPTKWGTALTSIADLLGGFDATLEIHTTEHQIPLCFLSGERIPVDGVTDYLAYYSNICPRLIRYESLHKADYVGFDYDFMTEAELDKDEFYTDFLAKEDLRYYLSATLSKQGKLYSDLYVHRTRSQGHVGEEEITLMRQLMPHVASAFDIYQRLEYKSDHLYALETALDMVDYGALLLDKSGTILYANHTAEDILIAGDGLSAVDKKLLISDDLARNTYEQLLEGILGENLDAQWRWGGDVYVSRISFGCRYHISVRRLPNGPQGLGWHDGGAALVFITDPLSQIQLSKDVLLTAFGLTEAETGVALAFVDLGSVSKVAEYRQVSLLTVRTQLKHIMHKLDVHSLADLMRILLSFRLPLK